MLASSGFVVQRTSETCVGCGLCVDACPFDALTLEEGQVRIGEATCMGCGVCVSRCAHGVLALVRDPEKGEPLILSELLAEVRSPN